ncbi:MAG TPA: hypothetical protein VLT61_04740 [Anaeromyxobacteraceae bacterium]|nr:hypothetical protein [Anaeromyxobacteraceae bacterium]
MADVSVRQVQVRGCLSTVIALVVIGAIVTAVTTAGVALLAVAVGAGLVAAVIRGLGRLAKPGDEKTPAARRAADVTIDAEWVEPPEGGGDRPPKRLD